MGSKDSWGKVLLKLDHDSNGKIDYNKFQAAAMDAKSVSDEMIRATFDILDYDKSGDIDKKELKYAFQARSQQKEA